MYGKRAGKSVLLGVLCAALVSCSVKEDRSVCPCYLDVVVKADAAPESLTGEMWCAVYADDGRLLGLDGRRFSGEEDTVFSFEIRPRVPVAVVVSDSAPEDGVIRAAGGVWASRKDAACRDDCETVVVERLDRQFCVLTVGLGENMMEHLPGLVMEVTGDYDRLDVPAMTGGPGQFFCRTTFGGDGEAVVLLPRQNGPGLRFELLLGAEGKRYAVNLYKVMESAGYDWNSKSLDDFRIELSLEKTGLGGDVQDWELSIGDLIF